MAARRSAVTTNSEIKAFLLVRSLPRGLWEEGSKSIAGRRGTSRCSRMPSMVAESLDFRNAAELGVGKAGGGIVSPPHAITAHDRCFARKELRAIVRVGGDGEINACPPFAALHQSNPITMQSNQTPWPRSLEWERRICSYLGRASLWGSRYSWDESDSRIISFKGASVPENIATCIFVWESVACTFTSLAAGYGISKKAIGDPALYNASKRGGQRRLFTGSPSCVCA